jgi:hypothetical protein
VQPNTDPAADLATTTLRLKFDSDDGVPSGLLSWMAEQTKTPACVTFGSNATYCAMGAGSYILSDSFSKDQNLTSFLTTAQGKNVLSDVVSHPLPTFS